MKLYVLARFQQCLDILTHRIIRKIMCMCGFYEKSRRQTIREKGLQNKPDPVASTVNRPANGLAKHRGLASASHERSGGRRFRVDGKDNFCLYRPLLTCTHG